MITTNDLRVLTHQSDQPAGIAFDPTVHKLFFKEAVLAALLIQAKKPVFVENKPIECIDKKIRYRITNQCVREGLVLKEQQATAAVPEVTQ